jgi:Icc-related predicted phosphoesterase
MKVLFTCDLHGKKHLYAKMLELVLQSGADCIIVGGDLFPTYIANPLGLITGNAGFQEGLKAQNDFIDDFLAPTIHYFMRSHPDISLLYTPGNHDWVAAVNHLQERLPEAVCLHGNTLSLNGLSFSGYGCVTDSSFWAKDYVRRDRKDSLPVPSRYAFVSEGNRLRPSEAGEYALRHPSIEEELSGVVPENPSKTVCIFHSPPFDTGLDTLYDGRPIGSVSVRGFIEKHQPMMSLHGHIHESPYMSGIFSTRIGSCLAVNPGHSSRSLHAAVFDTEDPEGSILHSIFRKTPISKNLSGRLLDRYGRRIKSLFMQKALSAKGSR